jgi:hypothetical protein
VLRRRPAARQVPQVPGLAGRDQPATSRPGTAHRPCRDNRSPLPACSLSDAHSAGGAPAAVGLSTGQAEASAGACGARPATPRARSRITRASGSEEPRDEWNLRFRRPANRRWRSSGRVVERTIREEWQALHPPRARSGRGRGGLEVERCVPRREVAKHRRRARGRRARAGSSATSCTCRSESATPQAHGSP